MSHNKAIGFPPQDLSQLTYQSDSGTSFMIVTESHLSNAVAAEYLNFSGIFPRESSISQGYESQVSSSEHEKLENSQNSLSIEYMFRAGSQGYSQETMLPTVSCSAIDDRPLTFTGLFQRVCSEEHATEEYQTSLLNDNQPKSTSRMKRKPLADDNGRSDLKKPIKRPGLSYSKMIMDVLLEGGRMTVQEIVKCIQDKYPNNFNKEEKRWKACIRNCLTQKDYFIRETSKRKGNYWKLSEDLLRKLRPSDNSSQSEFLETSSVDRSTWNTGRYVTIAPKRAYYSDSSLDGVVKQGEFYPADISNDNYGTPLKSSVLASNRQCFSEERNLFNAEGEINIILDYSKSCHSLDGVIVQGDSYITDISNDSHKTPLKSSTIGNNCQFLSLDRNLLNSNLKVERSLDSSQSYHSMDGLVAQGGSYITDTSNGSYNTPLKLPSVGNSRHCFSEDRNLLRSNSNVIGERVKIIDYSKSCNQPNLKRGSEVFHDENGTPISRKRSRFARHTLPKVKTMQGFRGRLDMDKKLAQPEERIADRDVPYQFLSVSKDAESSSDESRGFNISSVSSERFDAKNRNQFARGSHQFKDLTNVLQNPSSTKKGKRYRSVTRNGEKIKTENRKSFLFKKIGEEQSFGSPIRSNGHSEGRLFSTDLLTSGDMLHRRKGSGETSTLVRSISLPNGKRNSVKDLNEISGRTGEATTRNTMTEITPAETSTAVRSISLDYDDRNSGEYLNECSGAATDVAVGEVTTAETSTAAVRSISLNYDDRNSEEYSNECSGAATDAAVGEITTAETLDAEISTSLYSDDIIFGEGLNEFPDDELRETTGEIATVESPNSDDIGRDEVFAALANETFSPPELGDTWDNFDLSLLDNL